METLPKSRLVAPVTFWEMPDSYIQLTYTIYFTYIISIYYIAYYVNVS